MQVIEDTVQNRTGAGDAGTSCIGEPSSFRPERRRRIRGEPNRASVAEIRARAGLTRHRVVVAQGRIDAERERARGVVAQDIGYLPD